MNKKEFGPILKEAKEGWEIPSAGGLLVVDLEGHGYAYHDLLPFLQGKNEPKLWRSSRLMKRCYKAAVNLVWITPCQVLCDNVTGTAYQRGIPFHPITAVWFTYCGSECKCTATHGSYRRTPMDTKTVRRQCSRFCAWKDLSYQLLNLMVDQCLQGTGNCWLRLTFKALVSRGYTCWKSCISTLFVSQKTSCEKFSGRAVCIVSLQYEEVYGGVQKVPQLPRSPVE